MFIRGAFFLALALLLTRPGLGQDVPAANTWAKLDKAPSKGRRWDVPVGYSPGIETIPGLGRPD